MRRDLEIAANFINPGARVLDLGCGSGELLQYLGHSKNVTGYGIEKDHEEITACISKGVNVIEHDLDEGLDRFSKDSFDMVLLTETLQAIKAPHKLLHEMLDIGIECIVTFPNFGHWACRLQLVSQGKMPIAKHLPHSWFDTPNIHLCTFLDFEELCSNNGIRIIERFVADRDYNDGPLLKRWPNLFGKTAFYRLGRAL